MSLKERDLMEKRKAFGGVISKKRDLLGLSIRQAANLMGIRALELSDIELANFFAKDMDMVNKIINALQFTEQERAMLVLAAENYFSIEPPKKETPVDDSVPKYVICKRDKKTTGYGDDEPGRF